jgi:hypothetical protein
MEVLTLTISVVLAGVGDRDFDFDLAGLELFERDLEESERGGGAGLRRTGDLERFLGEYDLDLVLL